MKTFFKYYFIFLFIIISSTSVFATNKDFINLSEVATYSLLPKNVFVIKNKLFLDYGVPNLYLTLNISKKHNKNEIKRLELEAKNISGDIRKIKKVIILSNETYQKILNEFILTNKISNNEEIFEYKYKTDIGTTKRITTSVKLDKKTNIVKTEQKADNKISKTLQKNFINIVKKYSNKYTEVLILTKNINDIVYFYVNTKKEIVIPLILPPYQKHVNNENTISNTSDFLYSFVVVNHVIPTIKSPFTTLYRLFATTSSSLTDYAPNIYSRYNSNKKDEMMNLDDFNKFLDEDLGTKEYKANIKLFIDGQEFFNDFINSIKQATNSIYIQTYIFKTDSFSMGIINLLKEFSKKIDVRVLIDCFGSLSKKNIQDSITKEDQSNKDIIDTLKENSNIKVRIHPDTWLISDHRKIFIIDNKKAYIGGMNIANEYRYNWHDLMVSLEGPIMKPIYKTFIKAWDFAGFGGDFAVAYRSIFKKSKVKISEEQDGMTNIRILVTSSTDYQIYDAQLEAIKRAKKRIYIENPYFTEKSLIEELVLAKKRGVDVKIIFPAVNDMVLYDKINLKIANYFIENGIDVYMYPKMSHTKAAIYDNWACIGSANFNKLSMFKNREINIAFCDEKLVNELLERLFIKDFKVSQKYEEPVEIPFIYYII